MTGVIAGRVCVDGTWTTQRRRSSQLYRTLSELVHGRRQSSRHSRGLAENIRRFHPVPTPVRLQVSSHSHSAGLSCSCHIFLLSQLTTLTIHNSLSLSLPAQDLPFSQIFPTIDSIPASGLTLWLYDWSVSSEHLGFYFYFLH